MKRLLVNEYHSTFDENDFNNMINTKLEISKDNIDIVNAPAIEFFNNNLNIDYFTSIFPEETVEAENIAVDHI